METQNQTKHLSDSILTEILARLPLRSISRFKSVCKAWRSTFESDYFRGRFLSLHQKSSSSSSWSLMYRGSELLSFHGCKTWCLSKSLASYNDLPLNTNNTELCFSNGLVLIEEDNGRSFVGNPVLKQWFQLPPIPQWFEMPPTRYESASRTYRLAERFGFVTRADENGVVLDFKVVRIAGRIAECKEGVKSAYLDLLIYSSETGRWTSKKVCSLHYSIRASPVMNLNGTLYSSSEFSFGPPDHEGVLLAHDFFCDSDDQCRVIRLPDYDLNYKWDSKKALTTSLGSVIYIKVLADQKGDNLLKIWRLNNDDDCWQLFSEILISFDASDYAPVAMHPFDGNIVYLWSQEKRNLVSCNLQRQDYKVLGDESTRHNDNDDHQDCFVNQPICEEYMSEIYQRSSIVSYGVAIQFTLPRWMESMPRPPQAEEMDTLRRDRKRKRRF